MTAKRPKQKILIVDDVPANIEMLIETLMSDYEIRFATNGPEALGIVSTPPSPDLILLDIMMPEMDGYEVCRRLKANTQTRNIPVVFITTKTEEDDEVKGFELEAADYITKPFSPAIVRARVKTHLELKRHRDHLEELVDERTEELRRTQMEIVNRLGRAAEFRDNDTGKHVKRLGHYCSLLGGALGMNKAEKSRLLHASSMHDVGKIGIADSILMKSGKLTPEEWEIMKTHTTIGSDLLGGSDSELLELAKTIALTHHEKWDGTGYPQGLKGEEIPLEGRITALCDMFDALTTKRPYKEQWSTDKSLEEIKSRRDKHLDPNLVDLFFKILPDIIALKKRLSL